MIKYPLASNSWNYEELGAIIDVLKSGNYTMGKFVKKFEEEFALFVGSKYSCMVNSGSSANLLMLSILKYKYGFLDGDVIVPTIGWSTTYYPVYQNGFKLNFVDIDKETLNIDPFKIESAITEKTRAILAVNLLGNPCNFHKLREIAKKHHLILLEDNCESFGAKVNDKFTGTLGLMGTYSLFFSHHLQTMEGGMVVTNDDRIIHYLRSLRAHGWCRELPDNDPLYKKSGDWFKDHFTFILPGYSVRPLEIEGAIGSIQLKKWPQFIEQRRNNYVKFRELFSNKSWCQIQKQNHGLSSWYCFSLIFQNELEGKREAIARKLIKNGIEIRPIMTGNFMKNPCMKYMEYIDNKDYDNTNFVDENGLFIGNHVFPLDNELEYTYSLIAEEL